MFSGLCGLYGRNKTPKEKEKLIKEQEINRIVAELNLLNDGLYANYNNETWKKLNRITFLKTRYLNLTGETYRRKDFYPSP